VKAPGSQNGKERQKELAIQGLLLQPTIELAAEYSGVSKATLYRFLAQEDFQRLYKEAKQKLLEAAVNKLGAASAGAVDVLVLIAHDAASPQACRVSAARAILQLAISAGAIADLETRLALLESGAE